MKTALIYIGIALIITAGDGISAQAKPQTGAGLAIGKTRKFERGRITVKFLEIAEDSRCPKDVNCIWAGNAKIKVRVGGRERKSEIIELNTNTGPRFIEFAGRIIKLDSLLPYPKSDAKTPPTAYRAVISVSIPSK